jgi:xanthine dehydrogenase accessory factor
MKIYPFLKSQIEKYDKVMLLLVVFSKGSSPGRSGFKMGVGVEGEIYGSIGGGIMEYKLVEEAKTYLKNEAFSPTLKKQIHRGEIIDGSGLICSGEQLVLFYILEKQDLNIINLILLKEKGILKIEPKKIAFDNGCIMDKKILFEQQSQNQWIYQEKINHLNQLYIVGAGHVGLATSEIFSKLDFEVTIIDDRKDLNTLINNSFIDHKIVTNYKDLEKLIPEGENIYITIMTNSFKNDKIVLKKLISKKIKYIGVLGSKAKIKKMFLELQKEGISKELLEKVYAPIGLNINSKTPMEIAVSVAGEVLRVRNG